MGVGDLDPTARSPSAVVVGPEGGLTAAEIELAIRLGATPVRLAAADLARRDGRARGLRLGVDLGGSALTGEAFLATIRVLRDL